MDTCSALRSELLEGICLGSPISILLALADCFTICFSLCSHVALVVLGYGQLTGGELSILSWRSWILFLTWRHLTLRGLLREEGNRRTLVQGRMKEGCVPEVQTAPTQERDRRLS